MKKRLFVTLLMAMMMPIMTKAQVESYSAIVPQTHSACTTFVWDINGQTYSNDGATEVVTIQDAFLRNDTLYVLDLTLNPQLPYTDSVVTGVCSHVFNDTARYQTGTYFASYPADNGVCPRTITLHLTVVPQVSKAYEVTACASYVWPGNGETYTASNQITDYTKTGELVYGNDTVQCDSILSLDLTIIEPQQMTLDTTVTGCDKLSFKFLSSETSTNSTYTTSQVITSDDKYPSTHSNWRYFHGRTPESCFDSVITANLIVNHTSRTTRNVQGCDFYNFESFYLDENGDTVEYGNIYTSSIQRAAWYNGKNADNCNDSIILNITIRKSPSASIDGDINLNPGNQGTTLYAVCDQNVTYKWFKDNTAIAGATDDSLVVDPLASNTDFSLVVSNTSAGFTCTDTTMVTVTVNEGIGDVESLGVKLYPNPATDHVVVECDEPVANITLYNAIGQRMLVSNESVLNIRNLAAGAYAVRIQTQSGNVVVRSLVVNR